MRLELFLRGNRVAVLEARLEALEAERAALLEGLRRVLEAAGLPAPPALGEPEPRKLRVAR